jgi:hypothetical protein
MLICYEICDLFILAKFYKMEVMICVPGRNSLELFKFLFIKFTGRFRFQNSWLILLSWWIIVDYKIIAFLWHFFHHTLPNFLTWLFLSERVSMGAFVWKFVYWCVLSCIYCRTSYAFLLSVCVIECICIKVCMFVCLVLYILSYVLYYFIMFIAY